MMRRIRLNLKERSYDICVGSGILTQLPQALSRFKMGKDAVIITHSKLARLYGQPLMKALKKQGYSTKIFNVPEGESSKSAACAMRLLEQVAAYDVNKRIFIIALGGGVIGDLAGFVAAIYKRGVPYIQVPTTLLAQIDSAIGGKTAIDLTHGKNLVGAIYQPKLVWADTSVLKTLSQRQIKNGLAEAIKYGVIKDPQLFKLIEKNHAQLLAGDAKVMETMIASCVKIKAIIVAADEKDEKGIRAVLNFGHTVGHAIEAASHSGEYQHGEAIALGMRIAAKISVHLKMLSINDDNRLNAVITRVGLPKNFSKVALKDIMRLMMHDKKFVGKKNCFVLAKRIGQVDLVTGVDLNLVKKATQEFMR